MKTIEPSLKAVMASTASLSWSVVTEWFSDGIALAIIDSANLFMTESQMLVIVCYLRVQMVEVESGITLCHSL